MNIVIDFQDEGLKVELAPAFVDLNTIYRAASEALLKPHSLAIQLGRLSEERSNELLARVYAESVIIQTDPAMDRDTLFNWLLTHPSDFVVMRSYAEHRPNFEASDGNDRSAGPTPGGHREEAERGSGTPVG